jgi:hypothetical protein
VRSGLVVGAALLLLTKVSKGLMVRHSTGWWILEGIELLTLGVAFLLIMARFVKLQREVDALQGEVAGLKNRLDKIALVLRKFGAEVTKDAARVVELVTQRG